MKAVQILGDKSSPLITTTTTTLPNPPNPTGSQALLRVRAAGVTADEITWPELYASPTRVPGHDVAGVVAALGPEALHRRRLRVGQRVFGMLDANSAQGGQAEYVLCGEEELAPMPVGLSFAEAAALPIPLLTAWEALIDRCDSRREGKLKMLVTGASGAVGRCFVQLAAALVDAHVVALASARNHELLRGLGARQTLDYHDEGWETAVSDVDVVFDTAGGDVLRRTWTTVKDGGVIVTVADPPPPWAFGRDGAAAAAAAEAGRPGLRCVYFVVSPNGERLTEAARLVDAGAVRPLPVKTFPFEEAAEAWECARGRGRGYKVVIEFGEADTAQE